MARPTQSPVMMQQGLLWLVATLTLLLLLALSPSAPAAGAAVTCDTSWKSQTSGFWDVSANWTNGVPTSSTNACIMLGGAYTVTVRGSTNVAAGLTLGGGGGGVFGETLEIAGSTGAGDAKLTLLSQGTASGGIQGLGRLVLTSTDANAAATLDVAGGTLYKRLGQIIIAPGAGGAGGRFWHGALQQDAGGGTAIDESLTVSSAEPWRINTGALSVASGKTLRIDSGLVMKGVFWGDGTVQADTTAVSGFVYPGATPGGGIGTLTISGNYTHGARLMTEISGPSAGQFDVLRVTGAATVRGKLLLNAFKATLGQTFPILTAASRTGSFKKVHGAVIDNSSGLYYAPTYPPNGVTLEVRRATTSMAPTEGPRGTSVTLAGSGWIAGDSLRFILIDSARQKFTGFSRATVDGSGAFSGAITIPSGAATGAATVQVESTTILPLRIKKTFTVTS